MKLTIKKLTIKNGTCYDGRDIRGLFLACARWAGVTFNRTITVVISPMRNQMAQARGNTLKLVRPGRLHSNAVDALASVSADAPEMPREAFLDLCSVVAWYMQGSPTKWYKDVPEWAVGRRVRFKRPPEKEERPVGLDYHEAKLVAEQAKLDEWEEKLAHAERFANRWRKKVRTRKATIRRMKGPAGGPSPL